MFWSLSEKSDFCCNAKTLAANDSSLLAVSISDTASSQVHHSRAKFLHFATKHPFQTGSKKAVIFALSAAVATVTLFSYVHAQNSLQESSLLFTGLIIGWDQREETAELWIRTKEVKSGMWTKWHLVKGDADSDEKDGSTLSGRQENLFSTNLSRKYEYKNDPGISNVTVEPILSDREGRARRIAGLDISSKFPIIARSEWGANEKWTYGNGHVENSRNGTTTNEESGSDTDSFSEIEEQDPEIERVIKADDYGRPYEWPLQYAKEIKFIVLHHTASVSNLDNPKTAIQNIQYYHSVRRRWGDIGYNYIVDTAGNIYEGRKGGEGVVGGHARPLNKVSIGIAVLGDYELGELPASVLKNLLALIETKAKLYNIDIKGSAVYKEKTYNTVHGHFENSATLCPGKFLKQKLDGMKHLIAYDQMREGEATPPAYNFSDFEKREIIAVAPDMEKDFTIRLKNRGIMTWNGTSTFIESQFGSSSIGIPKILAKLQSPKVAPGNIGVFKGALPRLLISGLHIPQASLVINGNIRPEKLFPVPIMVEGLRATYEIVGRKDPPLIMKTRQRATAWIQLKNTGNFTWRRAGKNRVRLGTVRPSDHKNPFFKNRTRIANLREKEVKPGDVGTFIFHLKAPQTGGAYKEYFVPIVERVMQMNDSGMHFDITVSAPEKPLRVALSFTGKKPIIRSASGMKLYEGTKLMHTFAPNESVTVARLKNGKYRAFTASQKFTLELPPRFSALENGILEIVNYKNHPAWNAVLNDNMYRGVLEVQKVGSQMTVINELQLEDYLKGIAEVSNGDSREKIKTIIILARSYATYYRDVARKFPGKPYDLDDNPDHTQKYLGYGIEKRSPNIVSAVLETRGRTVTYQGNIALTPYFSQSDGRTRSAQEVWGWTHRPYLVSVPDPFCAEKVLRGHGVGLSGCGATSLAKQGKTAEEIIKYYYKGVEITD